MGSSELEFDKCQLSLPMLTALSVPLSQPFLGFHGITRLVALSRWRRWEPPTEVLFGSSEPYGSRGLKVHPFLLQSLVHS